MGKPFVLVELDKPRKLRYTINALVTLEETLGKPITEIMAAFTSGLYGFKEIRALLWAGLLDDNPDLTPEEAGTLLDEAPDFTNVIQKIGEALEASFGTQKKSAGTEAGGWDWDLVQRTAYGVLGLKPWELGKMTMGELSMLIDGYNDKLTNDIELSNYTAWLTANLIRAKKIPPLSRLLNTKKKEVPIEEQREAYKELMEEWKKVRDNGR